MISDYLTLNEAARRLNISCDTVRRMINAGMQAERIGSAWCIRADVLNEFAPAFQALGTSRLSDGQRERHERQRADMAAQDCVTGEEAARIIGVEASGLRRRIRAGVLPGERRGGVWWIKRADLEAYMERRGERNQPAEKPPAQNGNGHRTQFVESSNGPATWAELYPQPNSRRVSRPVASSSPPDSCTRCGRRCVTIGGLCMDCVWGFTR